MQCNLLHNLARIDIATVVSHRPHRDPLIRTDTCAIYRDKGWSLGLYTIVDWGQVGGIQRPLWFTNQSYPTEILSIRSLMTPAGTLASAMSPTFFPNKASATGDLIEILPSLILASCGLTMV